jgi:predicted DNA-binding transcriptional regulator AlpA
MTENQKPDLSALLQELPPFVARNHPRFKELTGYSGRTLANLDAMKPPQGPPKRIMLGNTVAYERESLIEWLEARSWIIS